MLSSIFCDPMDWDIDDFRSETEGDEHTSQASSSDRDALSSGLQSLSDSLPCGTIATVSVSKHIVQATGKEVWTVDKVSSFTRSDISLTDTDANVNQHCCDAHKTQSCSGDCARPRSLNVGTARDATDRQPEETISSRLATLQALGAG